MNVHLFGAVASPSVAVGDEAASFLRRNFYVDDGLTSVPTAQEAVTLIESSQAFCASAKLRLHKFASNCKKALEALPPEDRAKDLKELYP